jgi:hypothetical protein
LLEELFHGHRWLALLAKISFGLDGLGAHGDGADSCTGGSGGFNKTGSMNVAREGQTATLLANGEVLAAGGMNDTSGFLASSEVYNPAIGKWTLAGNMSIARFDHNAVLLSNGQVLLAGGLDANACCGAPPLATAELFNPATGMWTPTGSMSTGRENFVLTALPNGQALAAGGNGYPGLTSAELYNPASGTWSATGTTVEGIQESGAVLLANGEVFAFGKHELYNPTTGRWSTTPSPPSNRGTVDFETLLPSGQVWVGNIDELFNPSTAEWTAFEQPFCIIGNEHCGGGGALLTTGQVLVAGGTVQVEISGPPDRRIQDQTITTAVLWKPGNPGMDEHRKSGCFAHRTNDDTAPEWEGAGGRWGTFEKSSERPVPIAEAELYTP